MFDRGGETACRFEFFCVDLYHQTLVGDSTEVLVDDLLVPRCGGNTRLATFCIHVEFVGMSDNIETSRLDHSHQFGKVVPDEPFQIVPEVFPESFDEHFWTGVDIDVRSVVVAHDVYRSDSII